MNNVHEVHLDLTLIMATVTAQKVCYTLALKPSLLEHFTNFSLIVLRPIDISELLYFSFI